MKKIILLINKILSKLNIGTKRVDYIGGNDALPPPLKKDEEEKLVEKLESGGDEIRNILIERNLRLVVYIARKFENTGVGVEDLISVGTIGLIKAVNTFKPDKKIKLATYASRCIENEILMYIRSSKKYSNDMFLQDPVGHDFDGNEITVMDMVKSDDDPVPDEVSDRIDIMRMIQKIEEVLDEREREIIKMRYAIYGGEEITQREIAAMLGISRSYVSRIEKKALKKISACLND